MREVPETWLHEAWANRENVLLADGNIYRVEDVQHVQDGHAHVALVVPRLARGG